MLLPTLVEPFRDHDLTTDAPSPRNLEEGPTVLLPFAQLRHYVAVILTLGSAFVLTMPHYPDPKISTRLFKFCPSFDDLTSAERIDQCGDCGRYFARSATTIVDGALPEEREVRSTARNRVCDESE